MREFLDEEQYSINGILRYEKMFGRNYVSTGGPETTAVSHDVTFELLQLPGF